MRHAYLNVIDKIERNEYTFIDMEKFLDLISFTVEEPTQFGIWQICWIVFLVVSIFLMVKFRHKLRRIDDKNSRRIFLWIVMSLLLLETLKQLAYSYNGGNGWIYIWGAFPFVPCSVSMYVILASVFLKSKKARNICYWYTATFSVFSGLTSFIVMADVYNTEHYGIVVFQHMYHHYALIMIGLYLILTGRVKFGSAREDLKNFLSGCLAFVGVCLIAIIMSVIVHAINPSISWDMMYVNPWEPNPLPIIGDITRGWPYLLYLPFYIFMYCLASWTVMVIIKHSMKNALK